LGATPNVHNYNDLIYACTTAGHSDQAKYFYEALVAQNLTPDIETFAMVLGTCLFDNNALRAASFLKDMSTNNVLPTKPFFETVTTIFKNSGHKSQAAVFESLAKQSKVTQEEFDSALSKLGDLAKGEK
jgi:pentatricopeptide repeat protein